MASEDLRARIAAAIRAAACDGHCGRSEAECAAANPIEEVVSHFGQVSVVEGPVDALAEVVASAVQPELDRLAAERDQALATVERVRALAEQWQREDGPLHAKAVVQAASARLYRALTEPTTKEIQS